MKYKKLIFTTEDIVTVTLANHKALKLNSPDWNRILLSIPSGSDIYDKFYWNLTERQMDFFEECMDVAEGDVGEEIDKLWKNRGEFIEVPDLNDWSEEEKSLWSSIVSNGALATEVSAN